MTRPILLFLVGLGIYAALAGNRLKIHSQDNRCLLGGRVLKGQTQLARKPHHGNDWASYIELKLKGATAQEHGGTVKGFFTRRPKSRTSLRPCKES